MEYMSYRYDSDPEERVLGYMIDNVDPLDKKAFTKWCLSIQRKARRFYKLTGIKAELIGMQDVY